MPKATLEFNLPEEREEYELTVKAGALCSFIFEFSQYLRSQYKYNDTLTEEQHELLEKIREEFYRIMSEYDVHDTVG